MEAPEVFRRTVEFFESAKLDYFVTGSIASMFYGEARMTGDVDMVVDLRVSDAMELCRGFEDRDRFYYSEEAIAEAVQSAGQFNIVDSSQDFKVDFVQMHEGFDEGRMARRKRAEPFPGLEAWISSPEDVILKKLEFYKMGASDKHLRDIAGMLRVSGPQLDRSFLEHWALRLGVSKEWKYVMDREAGREPGPTV